MNELEFTCPVCGGHYFGRDMGRDVAGRYVPLPTVRCHGDGSFKPWRECWRGVWPPPPEWRDRPNCVGWWVVTVGTQRYLWEVADADLAKLPDMLASSAYGPLPEDDHA